MDDNFIVSRRGTRCDALRRVPGTPPPAREAARPRTPRRSEVSSTSATPRAELATPAPPALPRIWRWGRRDPIPVRGGRGRLDGLPCRSRLELRQRCPETAFHLLCDDAQAGD